MVFFKAFQKYKNGFEIYFNSPVKDHAHLTTKVAGGGKGRILKEI